jgi:DNA-binding MarR family transcriptional regulator
MFSPSPTSICACASLRRASRAVSHLFDLVLAPTGLKASQYIVLCAIAESGEIAHCDLARRFFASEETFSRRLASARKAGWVEMHVDARRRRVYRLTEAGHALLRIALPNWQRAQERLRSQLSEADWSTLLAFTERVTLAAAAAESAPFKNSHPGLIPKETSSHLLIPETPQHSFPAARFAADS